MRQAYDLVLTQFTLQWRNSESAAAQGDGCRDIVNNALGRRQVALVRQKILENRSSTPLLSDTKRHKETPREQ